MFNLRYYCNVVDLCVRNEISAFFLILRPRLRVIVGSFKTDRTPGCIDKNLIRSPT